MVLYDMFAPDAMFALTSDANLAALIAAFMTGAPCLCRGPSGKCGCLSSAP